MTILISRRRLLQITTVMSTALPLQQALACEYFSATLRVTHPWTRATPATAAHAVLGLRFDEVAEDDQLMDVQTPVAEAVMFVPGGHPHLPHHAGLAFPVAHGSGLPLDIPAGRETVLGSAETGATGPHLRLLRLTQDLEAARSYPLRLVFKKGGTVKALLNVDYARFI